MKVLMVEPGKVPYVTKIRDDLKAMQEAVGGCIQALYPYEDPVALVCNDDGKILNLPFNRALYDEDGQMYDIIAGKFFIVGLGEDNFANLSDRLAEKFYEQFKHPEIFVRTARGIEAVKQPIPQEDALIPKHSGRLV